ncbi:MAG: hypothetical protein WCT11_01955 [Candidatus Magasanikbacteria bacterium]
MERKDYPTPFSEAETRSFWNGLSKEQRIDFLKKANHSLGASETDLMPCADYDWDSMSENGLTTQLKEHLPKIGRFFEAELKAGQ